MSKLQKSLPDSALPAADSLLNIQPENPAYRHRQFIMNVSLISGALVMLGVLLVLYRLFSKGDLANLWVAIVLLSFSALFLVAFFLTKNGRASRGGGILLFSMFFVSCESFFVSKLGIISLLAFLTVAMGGLIILGTRAAYIITAFGSGIFILALMTDRFVAFTASETDPSKPGVSDVVLLILVMFVVVWLATYLEKSFIKANENLNRQSSKLQMALADIEHKRALGEDVSRQVFSLTAELNAIANQQASGSQQQASALAQVTAFLQQMTATAQNIANKTELLNQSSHQIKDVTHRVKTASIKVSQVGESGTDAVGKTINGNQKVNKLYGDLGEILNDLVQQQSQIREIVTTIRSISDETRLLSFNATLEAAGAGEYGSRFAVVAGEVKALSDRSVLASQQVSAILGQVEQRIQHAVSATASGHQEIETALTTAQQSSEVLRELMDAIRQTASEIEQIDAATSVMNEQSKEISYATSQQYSASNQALETLQSIGTVAAQYASGSAAVTQTTHNLEQLSHNLLKTLGLDTMSKN